MTAARPLRPDRSDRPYLAAAIAFVLLAIAAAVDGGERLLTVDEPVTRWAVDRRTPGLNTAFRVVTTLGAMGVVVAAGAVVVLLVWRKERRQAMVVALVTATRPIVEGLLKLVVGRERPVGARLADPTGSAFPSGHVFGTASLCLVIPGAVAVLASQRNARVVAVAAGIVLVTLVAVSRVYLGVHWATDTVGGLLAAVVLTGVAQRVVDRRLAERSGAG